MDMMIREFMNLVEGRDAPLYHGTSRTSAAYIVAQDEIAPRTFHEGVGKGVSLTRMKSVAYGFGEIIFVLDQTKLAQRYKIKPMDFWSGPEGKGQEHNLSGVGRRRGSYAEAEEYIIGAIKPASAYILAIEMKHTTQDLIVRWDERRTEAGDEAFFAALLNHPLLRIV